MIEETMLPFYSWVMHSFPRTAATLEGWSDTEPTLPLRSGKSLLWWCELDSLCATPHYVFLLQSTWTQRRNITIEKRALRLERQRGSPMFVNCDEALLYCVSPTNVVQRYSWMRSRSQVVNVLLEPNMSKSCACSNWSYPQRQKWHRIWSSS